MRQNLQHNIELLVVTLAQTRPGKEVDTLAQISTIMDTLRHAPGLVTSHFYHGNNNESTFLILTTWEDAENWHKAQERYDPRQLLLSLKDLLNAPPEQCLMSYVWGYSRPSRSPVLASAHLVTLPTDKVDQVQAQWIQALQQTNQQMLLTFAFLAQGQREHLSDSESISGTHGEPARPINSIVFGLFTWSSEAERDEFYGDPQYQAVQSMLDNAGHVLILSLRSF